MAWLVAAGLVLATGCSGDVETDATPDAAPEPQGAVVTEQPGRVTQPTGLRRPVTVPAKPFTLSVTASLVTGGVQINATTNLPDQSLLSVRVGRVYHIAGMEGTPTVRLAGGGFPVTSGKMVRSLAINESDIVAWADPNYTIDIVDTAVTVCVEFLTGPDQDGKPIQPQAVRSVVGDHGEALVTSPQKDERGQLTNAPVTALEVKARAEGTSPALAALANAQGGVRPASKPLDGFCWPG